MARVINITEAKAQLSRLVEEVTRGKRVIIGKAGKPVAVLQAYESDPAPRELGAWKGRVRVADDFDAPLPDDLQRAFEGGES